MKKLTAAIALCLTAGAVSAQQAPTVARDWHVLDYEKDGLYGISVDKAYTELLQNKKADTVIVAIIDSGIDTKHEDLQPILWRNKTELAGGGTDADKNGYAGDIYGWNFLGGADPEKNVTTDSYESQRFYNLYRSKFEKVTSEKQVKRKDRDLYKVWLKSRDHAISVSEEGRSVEMLQTVLSIYKPLNDYFAQLLDKEIYTMQDVEAYEANDMKTQQGKSLFAAAFKKVKPGVTNVQLPVLLQGYTDSLQLALKTQTPKPPVDYRGAVVGDDYNDFKDRYYGNGNVTAGDPSHGTHVAGIIGAVRDNDLGMRGIAGPVKIMAIRAVPDGDEHDKDVALAIRYAVDNGAKIINMSFGKGFSPQQQWVEDAIRYAEKKDVLLVRAAGNESLDTDVTPHYPSPRYIKNNKKAPNMITVGASGPTQLDLTAHFSNYGKEIVDVFAPGVNIYSTLPGSDQYAPMSGTSMASPVVTGLAALLKAYYPNLSAKQLKQVIEDSAVRIEAPVMKPGTREKVSLAELCRTGGIVNAYEAVKMAETMNSAL